MAPNTFAFRGPAPVVVPLRNAADDVVRLAAGAAEDDPSTFTSGDGVLAMPLPSPFALPALRKGDGVRPTTGGVAVRDKGGVGRLIEGLSHEEKKSSSGSPAGVEVPSVGPLLMTSVMTTSVGYSVASLADRFFSSSLYFVAAFDVYLVVGSLLLSAALPPFDWKNLVADSLPPTFITRSWSHCHWSRFVDRTKEIWTPRLRWFEEQSRHR